MIEFGKKSLLDSVNVIKDFIKMMIPLTTGLITVYFPLLKFLGVETASGTNKVSANEFVIPTIFMFISLVAFIVTSFPLLSRHFDLGIISTIETFRKRMVKWRYIGADIGMGFFLIGVIVVMIYSNKKVNGIS